MSWIRSPSSSHLFCIPHLTQFTELIHLEIRDLHQGVLIREECSDCKAFHREIFRVPRLVSGREWEEVVVPVLRKWERFVGVVVSEARRGGVETL